MKSPLCCEYDRWRKADDDQSHARSQLLRHAGASEGGLNDVALVEAAREGDLTKLEERLQAGANVNYGDGSAQGQAEGHHSGKDHAAIIELLSHQPR